VAPDADNVVDKPLQIALDDAETATVGVIVIVT
jgi:hypothetical protein